MPPRGPSRRYWPQFLPDGRHFLYYQRSAKAEHQGTYVTALDSSQSTRVLEIAGRAVYASGHLLFVRDGILFAQAFDDRALRTSGEPIRVADGVGYWASTFAYTAVTASSLRRSGSRSERGDRDQPSLARSRRSDNWTAHHGACLRIAAPVARSNERPRCHHRCDDRAARCLAAGASPWHKFTRDVRPIERLVSGVVA